ncbi:GntR family transcriptional regulator [Oceanobacter sp. 3_MG-2023]|jgi:DNA-binding GntR family transcriptional regulator|uniref:GntR family transcriptional regulator n=1 Tax=Oceanobacter sp. 3_MG-2023 TaxID=3062622 RepID=UPI002736FA5A|nr:GntR family transcriptional regulator [Oceanobacter sp. 3_MG-2023]MDP2505881.1 GntR family transcriptional regulator [Oceanobacter sp. 3_MG-2023]
MITEQQPQTSHRGVQDARIYQSIFEAILEQRLLPGTKLNEAALAEVFSVSRTIIRRALARLAQDGVIELIPNKGATVASPTPEQANDTLVARQLVEEAVLKLVLAIPPSPAKSKGIKQLRKLIAQEQRAFETGDKGNGLRLSGEFHLLLAEMANNQALAGFLSRLVSQTSLIIATYESPHQHRHCSYEEHMSLVDAIESGQTAEAIQLMNHHMEHIQLKLQLSRDLSTPDLHRIFASQTS